MAVDVGQEAPDFELRDNEGQSVKLSDYRGKKNVLLVFYPFAFSPTCQGEFCTLRDSNADLAQRDDLEILGVSVDPVWALKEWRAKEKFVNRFLSDFWPHGGVSQVYGAFDETLGFSHRHTFLIDTEGVVRYVERNSSREARDQAGWRKALDELAGV